MADQNPFSRQSMIEKRKAIVSALREERTNEESRAETSQPQESQSQQQSVQANETQPESDSAGTAERSAFPEQSPDAKTSAEQVEFLRRERALLDAQEKVRNSTSELEKRQAKAEEDEKRAQASLQKLEWAKSDPVGFLAELGWTEEDWKEHLASGGKTKPEVKAVKAMQSQIQQMEERYKQLEAKAEASARRAAIESENAAFQPQFNSYTFVPKVFSMQQLRMKQLEMSKASGTHVSLTAAADSLENEMVQSLNPLLQHEDVRRKLNLGNRDQSSVDKPPQAKTQNGKPDEKSQPVRNSKGAQSESEDETESLNQPYNWAARKRQALKTLSQNSL